MIYLDNAATHPMLPEVIESMYPYMQTFFGNAETDTFLGRKSKEAVCVAREQIAKSIVSHPDEIVFTSGGTESNNTLVKSFTKILASSVEHPSVLRAANNIETIPVGGDCLLNIESYQEMLKKDTDCNRVVSVMMVNNETGTIQDIKYLAKLAHDAGWLFHTDATQAYGKIPINVRHLDVDYMTLSAHKMGGPKGVGALYVKNGVPFRPLLCGGHQEFDRRAGTSNVPGIVGFGVAATYVNDNIRTMMSVRESIEESVTLLYDLTRNDNGDTEVRVNGDLKQRVPNIINLHVGVECSELSLLMNKKNIYIACGSACSTKEVKPSHVLTAMGLSAKDAFCSVRMSAGYNTTKVELTQTMSVMSLAINEIKQKEKIKI